ncbi:TPA: hypothetical protein MC438_004561 [Enterobacter cloacae]|nr:hypothetical protein [Enterobacter cloacae]
MKYLSLQQAMLGMRVIMTDDGLILKSPAGSAHYDLKGRRRTVWGDASFFPEHMRVKDKRKPNLSRVVFEKDCTTIYSADGKPRVRIGCWDNPEKPKGWRIQKDGLFMTSHDFNPKKNINEKGQHYASGMALGVEDEKCKITFKADRYKVHEAASSIIGNAVVTKAKIDIALGDETMQAVIDAVRESDLFASLQAKIDAQTASVVDLQQALHDTVNAAIRNAMKPGGLIWARLKGW